MKIVVIKSQATKCCSGQCHFLKTFIQQLLRDVVGDPPVHFHQEIDFPSKEGWRGRKMKRRREELRGKRERKEHFIT